MCQRTHAQNRANANKSRCMYIGDVFQLSNPENPPNPLQKIKKISKFCEKPPCWLFFCFKENCLFWRYPNPPPALKPPTNTNLLTSYSNLLLSIDPDVPL